MKTDDRNSNTNLMKHNFLRCQKLRKWPVLIKLIKTEKWPPSDTLHAQWIIIAVRLGPAYTRLIIAFRLQGATDALSSAVCGSVRISEAHLETQRPGRYNAGVLICDV